MASVAKKCSGCKNNLPKKEYMICVTCKLGYDLFCANILPKRFYLLSPDQKNNWNCSECRSNMPKSDNSNTPVRTTNPSAVSDDDLSECENRNITTRINKQRSKSDNSNSYVTEDKLRKIINQELTETIKTQISENLANINRQISGFSESLAFMSKQYDALLQSITEKNEIINNLVAKNEKLEMQVNNLTDRLCLVEQSMRSANLEITGIPENRSENLLKTVEQLARTIEVPIAEADILHVTRVAKQNKESNRPRSVVVKLCSQRRRDEILAAVSKFNKKNKDDKLNSKHLGLGGRCEPVFVSEHLTLANKNLHAMARKKAKESGFKFVWIRDGRIFARKNEQSHAIYIKTENSINLIS